MTIALLTLNRDGLKVYQLVPPILAASWKLNKGYCILTDIKYKLRKEKPKENFYQFIARKLGFNISVKQSNVIGYLMLGTGVIVSQTRLRNFRNKYIY